MEPGAVLREAPHCWAPSLASAALFAKTPSEDRSAHPKPPSPPRSLTWKSSIGPSSRKDNVCANRELRKKRLEPGSNRPPKPSGAEPHSSIAPWEGPHRLIANRANASEARREPIKHSANAALHAAPPSTLDS